VNPALANATAKRAVGNQRTVVTTRTVGFTEILASTRCPKRKLTRARPAAGGRVRKSYERVRRNPRTNTGRAEAPTPILRTL